MLGNVNVASEVCLLTGMCLTDVDRHEVCQAGEFGRQLAKLTQLGHEGRSGAGPEVEDERSAWPGSAEQRDDLSGPQVVQVRAGGGAALLGLLQHIRQGVEKPFLERPFVFISYL